MVARNRDASVIQGYLVLQDSAGEQTLFELGAQTTTIGRDPGNDIVLPVKGVSRRHAIVRGEGQGPVLEDLASRNGTYVNGGQLSAPHRLQDGDQILLGGLTLLFESNETTEWVPQQLGPAAIRVDLASAQVWANGMPVHLTGQEYRALALLYRERGRLVTKETLVNHLWPEARGGVTDDTLAQLASRLRRKLGDDADNPRVLKTVRGLGYRLIVP